MEILPLINWICYFCKMHGLTDLQINLVIVKAIGTRIKLAYALAQQWFGIFITAETSADGIFLYQYLLNLLSNFTSS